jgi:hypothetical protein
MAATSGRAAVIIAGLSLFVSVCAASFTLWQAMNARDTAKRQLRAYVIVRSQELQKFGQGEVGHVQGIVENVGQTPVYNATWRSGINVAEYPMTGDIGYPNCRDIEKESSTPTWFFGRISYPDKDRDRPFTPDEVTRIQAGRAAAYFHGRFCYHDIFGELRRTDFCMFWAWSGSGLQQANYCPRGNEAD